MSAAQALASEQFLDAMGPMVYEEQKVDRVIKLIRFMREEEQLPTITEEELKDCIPLDVAFNRLREHIHEQFQARVQA